MRAVSKEEAERSLYSWKKWANEVSERKDYDRNATLYFKYRNGPNAMIYPLEPIGDDMTLEDYEENLKINKTFCYKDYKSGRFSYHILDYYLNKKTETLSVATHSAGGVKSLFLTSITKNGNVFNYETRSFFAPDGLEKYMTLARGEEWTGGDVFDDFC